ncbi:MAG: hypothetical protein ACI376_08680 [Candidatus Bruticola sp.]
MLDKTAAFYVAILPLTIILSTVAAICLTALPAARSERSGFCLAVSGLLSSAAAALVLLVKLPSWTPLSYGNGAFTFNVSTAAFIVCLNILGLAELYSLYKRSETKRTVYINILLSVSGLIVCTSCHELICLSLGMALAFWPMINTVYRQIDSHHSPMLQKADHLINMQIGASACLFYSTPLFLLINRTTIINQLTLSTEAISLLALIMLLMGLVAELVAACLFADIMRRLHNTLWSRFIFLNVALALVPLFTVGHSVYHFLFT